MYSFPSSIIHWSTYSFDITAIFLGVESDSQFLFRVYCINKNLMLNVHSHFLVLCSRGTTIEKIQHTNLFYHNIPIMNRQKPAPQAS
ncbi:Uncharacterised protein [Raoultella planticola]|uniref:Uncharacterized protein n=1 Tax=Raoultella planticola TaxID=575 RepID=A0A8G2E5W2_RAOPL|nr:Uncharacterised protein [Raoultella planticola]